MYQSQSENIGYKNFTELNIPIVGTWDDHDFGENDGDKTYEHRRESQALFLDFFNVPKHDERRRREGVYSFYDLKSNSGKTRIRVILLDNRYHKDPYQKAVDGDMLGEVQWRF